MSIEILTRAALGSIVPLGTLYDSRTHQFLEGISITNRRIPPAAIEVINATHSYVQYTYADSISEKCSRLGVSGDFQISILLGLVTLAGSGSYITYPKSSATSTRRSLVYKVRTKDERLNVFHPDLKPDFSVDALRLSPGSTHFVSQIHWGANSVLMCEYVNKFALDEPEMGEKLQELLETVGKAIKRSTDPLFPPGVTRNSPCHQLRLFGDILPDDDIPDSLGAAVNILKQIPGLINASDSGWGVPVSYTLLPISILSGYQKQDLEIVPAARQIDTTTVAKIVHFLDTMEAAQQQLFDLHAKVKRFEYSLQPAEVLQVFVYKKNVDIHLATLKSNLSTIINGVKMNTQGPESVEEFLVMLNKHDFAPANITKKTMAWTNIKKKLNFAKRLNANSIEYLRSDLALEEMIEKSRSKKLFVLYIQSHGLDLDLSNWRRNTKLFLNQKLIGRDQQEFVVVDCNLVECPPINVTSAIQLIESGSVTVEDLLQDQKRFEGQSVARFVVYPRRLFPTKLSNELFPYTTHCPGRGCTPGATYNWTCSRCGKTLLIGDDDILYCDCGQSFLNSTSYKCSDPRHGDEFTQHDDTYLQHYLSSQHHVSSEKCFCPAKIAETTSKVISITGPEPDSKSRTSDAPKPNDCLDVLKISGGVAASGVYEIYLDGDPDRAVQVSCDQATDGGGWTVFQRRMDATDFYKDWNEYVRGFGNKYGSHWLGLSTLAALTKGNDTELRVDLEDWDGEKGFAVYKYFHIADEADKFRLDVSGYFGNTDDSLAWHNGMAFSTKDNDNDDFSGNCSQDYHGAWWYNGCVNSNLNGLYHTSVVHEYVTWGSWQNWKYTPLKRTEMKIRKRSFKPTN